VGRGKGENDEGSGDEKTMDAHVHTSLHSS